MRFEKRSYTSSTAGPPSRSIAGPQCNAQQVFRRAQPYRTVWPLKRAAPVPMPARRAF